MILQIFVVWFSASLVTFQERELLNADIDIPIGIKVVVTIVFLLSGLIFRETRNERRRQIEAAVPKVYSPTYQPPPPLDPKSIIPFQLYENIHTIEMRLFCHQWEIRKIWGEDKNGIARLMSLAKVLIYMTDAVVSDGYNGTVVVLRGPPERVLFGIRKIMDVLRDIPMPWETETVETLHSTRRIKLDIKIPVELIHILEGPNKLRKILMCRQTGASVTVDSKVYLKPSGAQYKYVTIRGTAFQISKTRDLIDRLIENSGYPKWRQYLFRLEDDSNPRGMLPH